jgi:NDP-sugar pyrophosphorylase family protein
MRQAFVLGAGLGTRLRPLTDDLPKPLVPIFQKPLITFAFDHLIAAGFEEFVVNTHRQPERFAEHFPGDCYLGRRILFLNEPELLGTGGGIRNAEPSLASAPFVVYSGDILTDFALAPLLEEHLRAGNDVTLALRKTTFPPTIALEGNRITDIGGKLGRAGEWDFANVSVWNREIARQIPAQRSVSFIPTLIDAIRSGGKIGGVVTNDGRWFNVGSPREYLAVHRTIAEERWTPPYLEADSEWPVRIAPDAAVDPTATLSGFCAIGAGARIGAGAQLENTIVWRGAQIASRTHLRDCIVRTDQMAQGVHSDTVI